MISTLIEFHNRIFFDLHSLTQNSEAFRLWIFIIAERIDWYVVLAGILFIVIHDHKRSDNRPQLISREAIKEGLFAAAAVLIALGISHLMKIGFAIPRPFLQFSGLIPLFEHGGYNSFPSGHATLFSALATIIYLNHKKTGIFFFVAALLIGFARVVAGVHFPIDVIGGWVFGAIISWLVYKFLVKKFS